MMRRLGKCIKGVIRVLGKPSFFGGGGGVYEKNVGGIVSFELVLCGIFVPNKSQNV